MAYCRKCGKEIDDEAIMCVHCGVPTNRAAGAPADPNDTVNPGLIVLSVLVPFVGIILGIVNLSGGKKRSGSIYLYIGAAMLIIGGMIGVTSMMMMEMM